MSHPSKAESVLIAVFLVFLGAVPLVDLTRHLCSGYLPGRPPFDPQKLDMSFASALSGKLGTSLERGWMNHSVVLRGTVGPYNETIYRLTQRLPSSVRAGRGKWLFPADRNNEITKGQLEHQIKINVEALKDIRRRLRKKNADLVVALIPDRARLYPERYYSDRKLPPNKSKYLTRLVEALRKNGVESYDLTKPMQVLKDRGVPVTNSDDHHWNALGARAAAEYLGKKVDQRLRGRRLEKPPYRVRWIAKPSKASLLNKLGFVPRSELEQSFRKRERFSKFKAQMKGPKDFVAAYWSTSFGQYGSPQFFANTVRRPVRILQENGLGSAWVIQAGGLDQIPKSKKGERPFIVIWEIPEYHTSIDPDTGSNDFETLPNYLEKLEWQRKGHDKKRIVGEQAKQAKQAKQRRHKSAKKSRPKHE